jgi:PAS domain S-box-containing protein
MGEHAGSMPDAKFRNALERLAQASVTLNAAGVVTDCNRFLLDLAGRAPDEVVGHDWFETVVPPEAREAARAHHAALLSPDSTPAHYEGPITTRAGGRRLLWWTTMPLRGPDGQVSGTASAGIDITDREAAEAALRATEEQYRGLYEALPGGVIVVDSTHTIIEANQAARAILRLGSVPGPLPGSFDPVWEAVHEDGTPFPGHDHPSAVALRTGQSVRGAVMGLFVSSPEGPTWVLINSEPLRDPGSGEVTRAVVAIADITERKRLEDAVLERERILARAQVLAHLGNWTYDPQSDTLTCSDELLRIVGWDPSRGAPTLADTTWGIHPDDRAPLEQALTTALSTGEGYRLRARYSSPDGSLRYLESMCEPQLGSGGAVVRLNGTVQDITEHRRMEEELQSSLQTVEALLNATHDLAMLVDAEGTVLTANQAMAASLGKALEEIIGTEACSHLPAGVAEARRATMQEVQRSGVATEYEDEHGGRVFANSMYPLLDPEGRVSRIAVFARDTTRRRWAESELANRNHLLDTILTASPVGIVLVRERTLLWSNEAMEEIMGWPMAGLVGISARAFYADDAEYERVGRELFGGAGTPGAGQADAAMVRQDGTRIVCHLRSRQLDPDDPAQGCIVTVSDITRRVQAEERLRVRSESLQAIPAIADELASCPDLDSVYRRVVEFAREKLGAERCALYLVEDGLGRGTYGTDMQGETADEHHITFAIGEEWYERLFGDGQPLWGMATRAAGGEAAKGDIGWNTYSLVQSTGGPIGMLFADAAISGAPLDPSHQEVVCLYCSLVGSLIEQTRALAAAREAEQRYRTLFDNTGTATLLYGADGVISVCNRNAETLCACPAAEIEGKLGWADFVMPEELGRLRAYDAARKAGEAAPGQYEIKCRNRAGELRDVLVSIGAIPESPDRIVSALDITESKLAVEKLQESEANFRTLFETMSDIITVAAPDGEVLFVNSVASAILGYSAQELASMHVLDLHVPERREEAARVFGAVLRGEADACPVPLIRKDGTPVPVETRVWFGRWDGVDCIFGISKDLSSEEEARERFERLFRHNPALMALSSLPDRRFTDVNDAFLRVLGYSASEVIGNTAEELGIFPDATQQAAAAERLAAEGAVADLEFQVRRKDGVVLTGLFSGEIIGEQGRQHLLTVMIDITALRRAEDSARLATVGQLAAGVAHEFNNLLGGMVLRAERAALKGTTDEYEKLAELVLRSTRRGAEICRNLTAFARPREPVREAMYIEAATEAALSVVARQLENAGVTVVRQQSTEGERVAGDPGQLEQVFVNLFINACHAMPGGGTLTVNTLRVVGPGPSAEVVVSVSDTGTGISPADLPRIFDPFFTTKGRLGQSDIPGTGLGLSVTHGIVTAHGGTIAVRSTGAAGTTLELRLPVYDPASAPAAEPQSGAPGRSVAGVAPLRILVADDEHSIRVLVGDSLEASGHSVVCVDNGLDAITALQRTELDLVVTDLLMPGAGGGEVLAQASALSPAVPVVIITGRIEEHVEAQLRQQGARACLRKPFGFQDVLQVIAEVTGGS